MRTWSFLFSMSLFGPGMFAQSNPFGCHFFHGQQAPMHPLDVGHRSEIESTIARSDTFDIQHYDIHLDVTDYNGQRITGATTVTFKALQDNSGFITFDLLELEVDSVRAPEGDLGYTHDGEYLVVDLGGPAVIDEERELTVYYQGEPVRDPQWGGFYFASNYIYNLGIGISTIPPHFGKVWYPCFDSFVERASYSYHVKSAGTFRFHGQGDFLGEVQLGGDTVIRSYHLQQAIPTHVSAIAVADYDVHEFVHVGAYGDVPVTLTAKPEHLGAMVARFGDLGDAIDACEYWYGPHGYGRVGYVLTTDGALEIPTNVAYPQFMTGQPVQNNRELLTHELGHMWWGNVVTPCIHNDMWLKEGPAEYSSHLIEEWIGGAPALQYAVRTNMLYVLRQAHVNDDGFQALSPMPDQHIYGTHTYYKGAAVMHNLRGYMGDKAFRMAMTGIQQQYANTTMCAMDFKEALEEMSGQDLDPFFDAWVFAPGYSVFEVQQLEVEPAEGLWNVGMDVVQKLREAPEMHQAVPLDLTFIAADGTTVDQQVVVGGEVTEVAAQVPFEPAMVVLNRHTRLNQARLDHEVVLTPGMNLNPVLPHVEFRAYIDALSDTALLRVEHLWVAPDQELGPDIITLSNTHYWTVDGLWPEGTVLRGRLYYYGANANQLDHGLIAGNEAGIAVVHRAGPEEPWQVYNDQVVTSGTLTNGTGFITVNNLQKGQYAFAKVTAIVGLDDRDHVSPGFALFPVPTSGLLTIQGHLDEPGQVVFDVLGVDGRIVQRSVVAVPGDILHELDLTGIAPGSYLLRAITTGGFNLGTQRFEVVR